jgi:hypothetical protein
VADRFDEPGAFATLIAYEWTGKMYPGPGHKCVYLPRRRAAAGVARRPARGQGDLVRAVRAFGGIASPHHIGWTGCDEPGHDPEGQPVWEICSCHGCYEHADHPLGMRGEHVHQLADVDARRRACASASPRRATATACSTTTARRASVTRTARG